MQGGVRVESLAREQRESAVGVLARAFRDNPLDLAVIGGDPGLRVRSISHGMRASLRTAYGTCTILAAATDANRNPVGILLAVPPGRFPLAPIPLFTHLRAILGQGLRVATRWGVVYRTLEEVHPREPHWYLSLLGVDPPQQRLGVGRALLSTWIERVDRDRMPSYLETDREGNLAFYERAGFRVVRELRVFGAAVWCMGRPLNFT
jgi:ribosomal protein S18 acetylase RimI-like enzyme